MACSSGHTWVPKEKQWFTGKTYRHVKEEIRNTNQFYRNAKQKEICTPEKHTDLPNKYKKKHRETYRHCKVQKGTRSKKKTP